MSNCKDCEHVNVCRYICTADVMCCKFFKDRSKFVDVSELQQNVIRPLTNRCAVYTKCLTCLACALEIRERCEHYKKVEKALKENKENEN